MARRDDSGWRDSALADWHAANGFACPAAGMVLPMIEYDRGQSVGIVNYIPRGNGLPKGEAIWSTYRAFGDLHNDTGGAPLPFLSAVYDPRNWAMKVFPHNDAAAALVGASSGWHAVPEREFAALLFAMRKRQLPDLFGYGVEWNTGPWLGDDPVPARGNLPFPCADMSDRRRRYEPDVSAPGRLKVPCLDVDLAVADQDDRLALVVDYKRRGALCDVTGTNATALASLARRTGPPVAALMTRYWTDGAEWWFETYPLNRTARLHLAYVLGDTGQDSARITQAVAEDRWIRMDERLWLGTLRAARGL